MHLKGLFVALLMVTIALAGCTQESGTDSQAQESGANEGTGVEDDTDPTMNNTINNTSPVDAWRLQVDPSPEGNLSGFYLEIPPEMWWQDDDEWVLHLDITPDPSDDAEITEWGFFIFQDSGDGLSMRTSITEFPTEQTAFLATTATETSQEADFRPRAMSFWYPFGDPFESMHVVVTAKGLENSQFSVLVHPDPDAGGLFDNEPDSASDILNASAHVAVPTPNGTGSGYRFQHYADDQVFGAFRTITQTPGIEVSEGLADAGGIQPARRTTIEAEPGTGGYSYQIGSFTGAAAGGHWSVESKFQGAPWRDGGVIVESGATLFGSIVTGTVAGTSLFIIEQDDAEPHVTNFEATSVNADYYEFLRYERFEFGVSLTELLGSQADPEAYASNGIVGDPPL